MNKKQLTKRIIFLLLGFVFILPTRLNSQVINTESFDGSTFVPSGWINLFVSGSSTWTRQTAGTFPTQAPHSGLGEAKFNSFNAISLASQALVTPAIDLTYIGSNTARVSLWMYRDDGASTKADKVELFINSTADLTGATLVGTIFRTTSMAPIESVVGWHEYTFNIPSTFTGASNYMIIKGISNFGNNIFIDDVSWTSFPTACSGSPVPAISMAGGTSLTAAYAGTTVTYQWLDCSTSNTVIPGATSSTYEAMTNGMYSVIADNGTCMDTSACVTINSLFLNSLSSPHTIKLSPNPTSGKVLITFSESMKTCVDVFDYQGKIILSLKEISSGDSISLDRVQPGIYTFKVTNEEGTTIKRILKN
jgi:hypothetical protein